MNVTKSDMYAAMEDAESILKLVAGGAAVKLTFPRKENEEAFAKVVTALTDALRSMKMRI